MRSLTSYTAAALQGELMESGALYRPGGPLYNDAYAASMLAMGLRVPPPSSPQKIPDMRDSYAGTMPGRGSPGRQSLRRDSVSSSVFGDSPKARGQGSGLGLTSEQLCLMAGPGGEGGSGGGFGSPLMGNETETRWDIFVYSSNNVYSTVYLLHIYYILATVVVHNIPK